MQLQATGYGGHETVNNWDAAHQLSLELKLPLGDMLARYIEQSVLVGIVEFVQKSEKGWLARMRSIVRLHSLNPRLRFSA